jgi:hypothetical protein
MRNLINAPVATVIAALIALLGTVLGLFAGYRRWRKERETARFGRFEADRQDIYKALWQKVEDVNVALRRDRVDDGGFMQLVADLNEFMLRNGTHIEDSDIRLANRYVEAVKKFDSAVLAAGTESRVPYGATQEIPTEILQRELSIGTAESEATRLRTELRRNIRKVLAGDSFKD